MVKQAFKICVYEFPQYIHTGFIVNRLSGLLNAFVLQDPVMYHAQIPVFLKASIDCPYGCLSWPGKTGPT
jgi:hypothetical protein